jgi:hypothetical protein
MQDFIKIRVMRLLDLLNKGIGPFIDDCYLQHYGIDYKERIKEVIRYSNEVSFENKEKLLTSIDTQGWLDLMLKNKDIFYKKLGSLGLAYASELMTFRISFAHQKKNNL